jgi:uncharacterized membrane protein
VSSASPALAQRPPARVVALVRANAWPLVVWTGMVGWSLALFATVRSDYLEFRLARFDLGNMVQAVWSTTDGRLLETTHANGEQLTRLASHVDPIVALLAPLWILAPSPLTLAAVQIAACALGALPVFWLGRRHLASEGAAALLALAYLAYPWLAWTALDAFHPVTLAIPLFLYAIWFLDTDRLGAFAVCGALVLATGELMGLPLAALGLWYWLSRGHRVAGLGIAAAGTAWTLVSLMLIVPAFRGEESPFYGRFASVGGSPTGIVETALTDPLTILSALATGDDLSYLVWLAWPLAGLFLLVPALAAVALPLLVVNGLSDWSTTTDPRHHYVAGVIPFLVAASVLAVARFPQTRRLPAAAAVLLTCALSALLVGPWPGAPGARPVGFHATLPLSHVAALRAAVDVVPDGAPVATSNGAGSHLSARRYVYSIPTVERAEWILLDTWDTWMPGVASREEGLHPGLLAAFRDRIRASSEWRQVHEQDGVFVFERVRPG